MFDIFINPHSNTMIDKIDNTIELLQHPFYMTIWGIVVWFVFVWSKMRNKHKKEGKKWDFSVFWDDQKDEVLACLVVGLTLIVWDDEFFEWIGKEGEELSSHWYLGVGAITERLYTWSGLGKED